MVKQPAITDVFPVSGTIKEKIKFLQRQIDELKAQKKCYDKMINDRKKVIKSLQKHQSIINVINSGKLAKLKPKKKR